MKLFVNFFEYIISRLLELEFIIFSNINWLNTLKFIHHDLSFYFNLMFIKDLINSILYIK